MKKDAKIFIEHILGCIGLIEKYTESSTKVYTALLVILSEAKNLRFFGRFTPSE